MDGGCVQTLDEVGDELDDGICRIMTTLIIDISSIPNLTPLSQSSPSGIVMIKRTS
jgi:hypothetical protein